jgi:hypothetical protein
MGIETVDREVSRSIATAVLRAAVAWTEREPHAEAWRELSRMTGVVSYMLGPGLGPDGPLELIELLHQPLSRLLGAVDHTDELGDLVLLGPDDQLTDEAIEVGCEYTQALFDGVDPGQRWLPSWAWQRAEQVERQVFEGLMRSGNQQQYASARRFLIEHPAGDEHELMQRMNQGRVQRVAGYEPIPLDRVWRNRNGAWWWPCPVCRWPMRVNGDGVECGYSHHESRFRTDPATATLASRPRLVKVSSARLSTPIARPVEGAKCLELAVWRFVTVPGVPEMALERKLLRIDGVSVEMWPDMDRVDLAVRTIRGRRWEVDVKDHTDPITIADNPPAARDIVVPDYRRAQVRPLARSMPDKRVRTISSFVHDVRRHPTGGAA